jgi:hypothetical protein
VQLPLDFFPMATQSWPRAGDPAGKDRDWKMSTWICDLLKAQAIGFRCSQMSMR